MALERVVGYVSGPMLRVSQRLLSLLQLTRMALVFTAVADALAALLMYFRAVRGPDVPWWEMDYRQVVATVLVSVGLYGFGMSLNDIIDRRRDARLAAHRPLPSGRVGVVTAHVVAGLLVLAALCGGAGLMLLRTGGWMSFVLVVWTALLITFYDAAGKYLVWPGLLTLGLVRFFHAAIPAPQLPNVWHPLLLLNHVAILSAVAYQWEGKRPALTRRHWVGVICGLVAVNLLVVGRTWFGRWMDAPDRPLTEMLWITPGLILPGVGVVVFLMLAWRIGRRHAERRHAGQALMLLGLLWLIVYDALFVAGYVSYLAGAALFLLFPIAWFSVRLMRAWGRILSLGQRPTFKRA